MKKGEGKGSFCETGLDGVPSRDKKKKARKRTRFMPHKGDFTWQGVKASRYKPSDGTWADAARMLIAGGGTDDTKFHLRYFELGPGGHTTLERHSHEHVVVCIRGRGVCRVRKKEYGLGFLDTIYIPPQAEHRLSNPSAQEAFGFFCIVDAERDRPRPSAGGGAGTL